MPDFNEQSSCLDTCTYASVSRTFVTTMIPAGSLPLSGTTIHKRQRSSLCPSGNGTTIGTFQQFTVLCNTDLPGDVLTTSDVFDLSTCVDICSSFHPKCEGVSFDGSRCTLKARLKEGERRVSRRLDSAIGSFPGATSNCPMLGGVQSVLGTTFNILCGFIIDGFDMVQNFAPTFQDCLNQCAATTGCAALSFDPSQEFGFKNCYLKTMVTNSSAVAADRRTDSAMAGGGMLPNLPANPGQPSSDPGVSIIPLPSSTVGSAAGNGVVFFTPPPGSSTGVSSTVEPSLSTADASVTQSPSTTALPSFFLPGPTLAPTSSSGTAVPETASPETRETSPSMAWIAAPVVGGIAAVALIAVTFIILKRWRRGHGKGKKSGGYQSPGFFTTWLPSSWTSSEDGNRRGNKRMTEISSGRKNGDALVSVRNSVAEFLTGRPMGMERLEDIEEGGRTGPNTSGAGTGAGAGTSSGGNQNSNMPIFVIKNGRKELRKSFNGLGQNEWTG